MPEIVDSLDDLPKAPPDTSNKARDNVDSENTFSRLHAYTIALSVIIKTMRCTGHAVLHLRCCDIDEIHDFRPAISRLDEIKRWLVNYKIKIEIKRSFGELY